MAFTSKQDAHLQLRRFAADVGRIADRDEEDGLLDAAQHLREVAVYIRQAADYIETLPEFQEDQSETAT